MKHDQLFQRREWLRLRHRQGHWLLGVGCGKLSWNTYKDESCYQRNTDCQLWQEIVMEYILGQVDKMIKQEGW
jgi:hypothetical protein